jgi:hypothetical protein
LLDSPNIKFRLLQTPLTKIIILYLSTCYNSTFCEICIELVFAVDEVVIRRAFYTDIVSAFQHEELTAAVFADLAWTHFERSLISFIIKGIERRIARAT